MEALETRADKIGPRFCIMRSNSKLQIGLKRKNTFVSKQPGRQFCKL